MEHGGAVAGREAELVREGDYWTVAFDGRDFRVRDSKGMRYLAELLSHPGVEIPALELAGGKSAGRISAAEASQEGLAADVATDAEPLLDVEAKAAYKRRLEELRAERDEAEAFHDPERAARARAEYEAIAQELAAAVGLGGRDRRAGTASERARLNVTRAIKTSIDRLGEHDDELRRCLSETVLTGRVCVFRPEHGAPVHWRVVTRAPRAASRRRPEPPETRYTEAGGLNIAYQVLGEGPLDLVFATGFMSHLDLQWTDPTFTRLLLNLADFSRLLLFDRRGVGLSDPVLSSPTLEERADDIAAVLDAVGSERAVLFGMYETAAVMAFLAATRPERARALVLYGPWAGGPGTGYPGSAKLDEFGARMRAAVAGWGRGETLAVLAPELGGNRLMRRLWGTFERASMSPSVARCQLDWTYLLDVSAILPAVRTPTLVIHCTGDVVPIESGRYVAEQIPGARFVPVPADWHAPLTGDMDLLTNAVEDFVTTLPPEPDPDRLLTTVLAMEGGAGTTVDDTQLARAAVAHAGGVVIESPETRISARFDGPTRAVRCALAALDEGQRQGMALRAGLHTGECQLRDDGLEGAPVSVAAELAARATPGEALATGTVRDLGHGSGIEFARREIRRVSGIPGDSPIFTVVGITAPQAIQQAPAERAPLLDRAALGLGRRAPAVSRATLRVVKGAK